MTHHRPAKTTGPLEEAWYLGHAAAVRGEDKDVCGFRNSARVAAFGRGWYEGAALVECQAVEERGGKEAMRIKLAGVRALLGRRSAAKAPQAAGQQQPGFDQGADDEDRGREHYQVDKTTPDGQRGDIGEQTEQDKPRDSL